MKLMSLGINRMSIENHRIICEKRVKNPSQPINFPFTAPAHAHTHLYDTYQYNIGHNPDGEGTPVQGPCALTSLSPYCLN